MPADPPKGRELSRQLFAGGPNIVPSLLACDFGRLADEIAVAESLNLVAVQWDVMDGHFVPNFTYGPPLIKSLRPATPLFFDAHLMMSNPGDHLDAFLAAGCDGVTLHLEAVADPRPLLEKIKGAGRLAGLAVNADTPVERLEPFLRDIDVALVMSVPAGFGGQAFRPEALDKIRWLRQRGPADLLVQVDGGIGEQTVAGAVGAGADVLVVGSAFYGEADRAQALARLNAAGATPPAGGASARQSRNGV